MRFVVYGAGAIGGVIGGRLAENGHDVALIARGPHHDAIRERGLRVESPDGAVTLNLSVVGHPSKLDFRDDDVVVLAMKSQDTVAALDALAATAPPFTAVVCAQNGVANEREALRRFERVYAMCVMLPAAHMEPGIVQAYSAPVTGLLDVGRYPEGLDETAVRIASALNASGFDSVSREDVMRWKYTKLLMNVANAIEAACGWAGEAPELVRLVRDEAVRVLRTAGIAFASDAEEAARRGDLMRMRPIDGRRRDGGSSWQSLARGTGSVEADHLNGEIVLLGRLHGVPTPANDLVRQVANRMAREGREPGSISPEDVLARLLPETSHRS